MHSFKFAASLQAAQTGPAPVLLFLERASGHGGGRTTSQAIEHNADIYAFLSVPPIGFRSAALGKSNKGCAVPESLNPFQAIWEAITGLLKLHDEQKTILFTKHVEPLQKLVLKVHDDYIDGFGQALKALQTKSRPLPTVVDFLEERRRTAAAIRDLTAQTSEQLRQAERRVVRTDAWDALKDYCEAITDYLQPQGDFKALTWYAGYLEHVKFALAKAQENPWWDPSISGQPKGDFARMDLINQIKPILDRDLPAALGRVNETYARLRVLLQ
jgi:hypothetical protein